MRRILFEILAVAVVVGITFFATRVWFPVVNEVVRTDTTYIDAPYVVEVIQETEVPVEVVIYETIVDTITSIVVETDTVYIETEQDTFGYHSSFLTQYPYTHRFLGLTNSDNTVSITTQSPDGQTQTLTWNEVNEYRIGSNVGLQRIRPKLRSNYYVEAGYLYFIEDNWTPYLQLGAEVRIFGLGFVGSVNINKNPFGSIGIRYKLN